ncbi:MAG: PQ-loop repeat-containing protein [Candidatus Omnitrophica bacterium]|nr:PQ-loop repeat-containing protein [Candidatus Omnitrophota bacterium]
MIWTIVGATAATLTMLSFIPQIIRSYRIKHVKDLSPIMLFQLSLGVSLWVAYGFYRRDPIIICANFTTLITLVILIVMHFKFGDAPQRGTLRRFLGKIARKIVK